MARINESMLDSIERRRDDFLSQGDPPLTAMDKAVAFTAGRFHLGPADFDALLREYVVEGRPGSEGE